MESDLSITRRRHERDQRMPAQPAHARAVHQGAGAMLTHEVSGHLAGGAAVAFSGCAHWGVKPYERETLALPEMQIDPNPVDSGYNDHIYFSIEGSSGGRSFGGGGCGCN